jgi:hypothetical protein
MNVLQTTQRIHIHLEMLNDEKLFSIVDMPTISSMTVTFVSVTSSDTVDFTFVSVTSSDTVDYRHWTS